jgi:F-type H+-transporting ATPase subunit delta
VREVIVDNEGNLDTWRGARKAVGGLGLSAEVKSALETLAAEGRLDLAKKLAVKAGELRSVTSKTVDAEVRSAVPLSKEQQAAVAKALPSYAPAGQAVHVNFIVDPAVLGGVLVTMKNTTIDLTVTSKLVDVLAAARAGKQQLA